MHTSIFWVVTLEHAVSVETEQRPCFCVSVPMDFSMCDGLVLCLGKLFVCVCHCIISSVFVYVCL